MKDFLYALFHPKQIEWRNPFRFSGQLATFFMIIVSLTALANLLSVQSIGMYLLWVATSSLALCALFSIMEINKRAVPLWGLYAGTPVRIGVKNLDEIDEIKEWLIHNILHNRWAMDIHTRDRIAWSRRRTDLYRYLGSTDDYYLTFMTRKDALEFKLIFG